MDKHKIIRRASSGMLRRVALVRDDVSEELSVSFIRVTRICDYEEWRLLGCYAVWLL
jgi:hypothetical protein